MLNLISQISYKTIGLSFDDLQFYSILTVTQSFIKGRYINIELYVLIICSYLMEE